MRMTLAVVALLAIAPLAAGEIIEGTVQLEGEALPGCTITLTSPYATYTTVSDVQGRFRIADVRAGRYQIRYELAGLKSAVQFTDVWRTTTVPVQQLTPFRTECRMQVCSEEPPGSIVDPPLCADVELHSNLIESLERGDRSALALLQQRYETTVAYIEKHRLAGVLLEHLPGDDAIWNELARQASVAIHGRDDAPYDVRSIAVSALYTISTNPRARTMLHEALQSPDTEIATAAIFGFAWQHDGSALPAIAAVLERAGATAAEMAVGLALFRTAEADALAFQYIAEGNRDTYMQLQEEK